MRVSLDKELNVRGFRVAALVRGGVDAHIAGARVAVWGCKEPVAILIAGPAGVVALSPEGATLTRCDIEDLAPGIWDRFSWGPSDA